MGEVLNNCHHGHHAFPDWVLGAPISPQGDSDLLTLLVAQVPTPLLHRAKAVPSQTVSFPCKGIDYLLDMLVFTCSCCSLHCVFADITI